MLCGTLNSKSAAKDGQGRGGLLAKVNGKARRALEFSYLDRNASFAGGSTLTPTSHVPRSRGAFNIAGGDT